MHEVGDLPALRTPVFEIGERGLGPQVAIVAGVHGDEWYGVAAVLRLIRRLRRQPIEGRVVLVPAANIAAIRERSRRSCEVVGDFNRSFHRKATSEMSPLERFAEELWTKHLCDVDTLVDLHSGGAHEILPHARAEGDPAKVLPLVSTLGLDYLMLWKPFPPGLLVGRALSEGIPAVAVEEGSGHELTEHILDSLENRIDYLLDTLGILATEKDHLQSKPLTINRGSLIYAEAAGLFVPATSLGTAVKSGDVLGNLTTFRGTGETCFSATASGVVFSLLRVGPAASGEHLIEIIDTMN